MIFTEEQIDDLISSVGGTMYGELRMNEFDNPDVSLRLLSHIITDILLFNGDILLIIKILDTRNGRELEELLKCYNLSLVPRVINDVIITFDFFTYEHDHCVDNVKYFFMNEDRENYIIDKRDRQINNLLE